MTLLSQLAALAAIAGTGVVHGTDVFCALVVGAVVMVDGAREPSSRNRDDPRG